MIQNIFPTKIYATTIDNINEVQQEIGSVIDQIPFLRSTRDLGYLNTMFTNSVDAIMLLKLFKTANTIDRYLKEYCKEIEFEYRQYSVYSWFTKNGRGDQLQLHHHNDVDITGTYYFQAEGDCGDFYFESPVGTAPHSFCYSKLHRRHHIVPETGKLVFFPGWIYHGVLPNDTDKDRISLSFNIIFKRL